MNVYAKFRCAPLRIKKALGIFRELIKTTTTRTTRVAFGTHGTRLPSPKLVNFKTKLAIGLSWLVQWIGSLRCLLGLTFCDDPRQMVR